jgi:nuclear pore complex protein Nup54
LLKLIQHLHLLIPALRSSAIRPEEEALRVRLEEIEEDVKKGRLRGKLNELWAVVGALVNAKGGREGSGSGTEWTVVDEEGLAQIAQVCPVSHYLDGYFLLFLYQILTEQQAGLQHLTKILQRDMKDLAVIQGKSEEEDRSESLLSSTSTLRASTLR